MFTIEGLNGMSGQGEWLFDLRRSDEPGGWGAGRLFSQSLYAWGVANDGTADLVVMDWRDEAGQSVATLLIQDVPNTDWVAFELYSGDETGTNQVLLFENLPYTYWASSTSLRENGVANADGDTVYGKAGANWDIDQRQFWAMTHNVGSQQTAGAGYVFHPGDFARLTVNRGRGGVRAEIHPGKKRVRFALTGFNNTPWTQALSDIKPEVSDVLKFLDRGALPVGFKPVEQDKVQYNRFRKLVEDARTEKIEMEATSIQVLKAYRDLFNIFDSKGVELPELTEWFHLSEQVRQLESPLAKLFLEKQVRQLNN